ncbi:hypothetical protein J2T60_001006 [Natronospira proteinivora]|uniref:Sugar transporter n=1 Tax=Natronospira proteinivora TaxID=1807133 RepID=A0ABT1G6W3_9GAMM|nr:hypothetical protein [Natronospira proteinivora]MCP1727041.1 hypothetical protein [Natronospira proteinivora]
MGTDLARPPRWYWLVSGLALVWMLFGLLSLIMDPMTSEAALEEMSEAQRHLYEARPGWIFALYALAIFTGLGGSLGLLFRKAWAVGVFAVSLVAVIIQFVYVLFVLDAIGLLGPAEALPFPLVIFAIGALLLWLSVHARKQGWID